jgi:hypothetical protein
VSSRKGIVLGDEARAQPELTNARMLDGDSFPGDTLLYMDTVDLSVIREVRTDAQDSTDFTAFSWPQLIIKKGWQQAASRFQARLTRSNRKEAALCTQSYVTVHVPETQAVLLDAACLSLNSMFATYYLMLTSGRFASYRPEALVMELLAVPLPPLRSGLLDGIGSLKDIDDRIVNAFGFKDAESVLIEDLFNYTLPDFQGDDRSPGRQSTIRKNSEFNEPELTAYCTYFIRVLKAGFGDDKAIKATIFQEDEKIARLPYRLVAFELDGAGSEDIAIVRMKLPRLLNEFDKLSRRRSLHWPAGGMYQKRVARVYETLNDVPTIFIVKPDMRRYWTRSAGLNDADEVALDLFRWHQATESSEVA